MLITDKSLQFGLPHESMMLSGVIANTWTVVLGGNIHLSLVLSIVNAMLACGKFERLSYGSTRLFHLIKIHSASIRTSVFMNF